ncbi:uncharacterized protein LOC136073645 [Hydra vulgaris]|uniref:uncharacterized protein LOC136073645 n=1 Tax=Hydra vulgaris TaxID=6087 RepID=UPI0032EA8616
MANKSISITHLKEIMDIHENTIMKLFSDRIDKLESKISVMQEENKNLKDEVSDLKKSVEFVSDKYENLLLEIDVSKKTAMSSVYQLNNTKINIENDNVIKDKLAELEDRSCRNNLRFNGIEEKEIETWQETESKIREILKTKLGLNGNIEIERAHRVGKKVMGIKGINRTIVVKFLSYKDKNAILDKFVKAKLWNENLFINEDFSERTMEIRRKLFAEAKELRSKGKRFSMTRSYDLLRVSAFLL